MYLARRLKNLPKCNQKHYASKTTSRNYTSGIATTTKNEANVEEQIVIPNRIQRKSTDILYALSSTVQRDATAPHYKYHDDPYLIPSSNMTKRTFAMAQEAGRKAAKWIKEEHRNLFMHQEAQPPIKAFLPKMVFTEKSEVDETSLQQLIMQSEIKDAVYVYNLMKEKGLEISPDLKQSLLELVCFYNNDEPLPAEWFEERWFKQNNEIRDRQAKTWKDGDLAEQLFAEITPKNGPAYCALIRGMAKYNQVERAYALLQEATDKQLKLDTPTYNAIFSIINFLKETADQRWDMCQNILQQMAEQQLKPDICTMNALLECVSSFGNYKFARTTSLKVLAEFKKLGIEPSLGTFYFLLIIFCRDRAPVSHVIVDILNEISGKEFTIQHPKDTFFFATAMDVCRNHLLDKSLAKKVDALLHTGNNYNLIGDTYKENVYYRHYFALLCQTESIEDFFQTYDILVPNIYTPEPGVMEELLKSIEINRAYKYMPRIWSDMVIFDHTGRQSLLQRTLKILISNKPNIELPAEQMLPQQFAKVALDIFNKILESINRQKYLIFTGEMIGDILALLVRGGEFEKANEIFAYIDKNQNSITGTPRDSDLMEYVEACIKNKTPSLAIQAVEYAVENHMDSRAMVKEIRSGFTLNEIHLAKLKSLVGNDLPSK